YIPYFRDIIKRKTKPHAFSWFIWGLLTAIAFFAQLTKGGGAGAWVSGFTSLVLLSIAVLALIYGEKDTKIINWLSFIGALVGLILWGITKNPLSAIIIVTAIDTIAYV